MAKDEEERAEAREVEKDEKVMYHCDQCGKNDAYMHKLKLTWLCKERAQRLVKVEPRRELSSNIYHLPTIDESEEEGDNDMKEEKVEDGERGCELEKEPDERTAREEEEEYILKGEVRCEEQLNLSVTSGSVAPQVMIYQAQHDYPKYLKVFCCTQCNKPFSSKSAAKIHRRKNCKGLEVISLCDI